MSYSDYIRALHIKLDKQRYEVLITYTHSVYNEIHTYSQTLYINDLNISTIKHELYTLYDFKYIHLDILSSKIINDRSKIYV